MKIKIMNYDPTGVEVESAEIELPVIVEHTPENGYKTVVEEDGTVVTYEPARQNRYYIEIGCYIYKLNQRTGRLDMVKKGED
jgi:hypothetical protein